MLRRLSGGGRSPKTSAKKAPVPTAEERAAAEVVAEAEATAKRLAEAEEAAVASAKRKLEAGTITQLEYEEIIQTNKELFDQQLALAAEEAASVRAAASMKAAEDLTTLTAVRAHKEAAAALAAGRITEEEFRAIAAQNDALHSESLASTSVEVISDAFMCPVCMSGFASPEALQEHFATHSQARGLHRG